MLTRRCQANDLTPLSFFPVPSFDGVLFECLCSSSFNLRDDFSGLGTSDKSSPANSFSSENFESKDLLLFLAYSSQQMVIPLSSEAKVVCLIIK